MGAPVEAPLADPEPRARILARSTPAQRPCSRRWGILPRVWLPWSLVLLLGADRSHAQPGPAAPPACTQGRASALSELGCEIARALGDASRGAVVVSAPLVSDAPLSNSAGLIARLTGVLGGALGATTIAAEAKDLAAAKRFARGSGKLVYLQPQITSGELRVTADVFSVATSFWDRVKQLSPPALAHAFASRRLDAELHGFLPPVPLVAGRYVRVTSPERQIVSVACGDLDGDGALELVVVGRQHIAVGRVRRAAFAPTASVSWTALAPVAASPLREPLASSWIEPGGYLDVGSSDRSESFRLSAALTPLARLGPKLPWPGGGCTRRDGLWLRAQPERCTTSDGAPLAQPETGAADALAGATIVDRQGRSRFVRALRRAPTGEVVLLDERGRAASLTGLGAQLAVADLDFDGQPELLAGADVLSPEGDALVVATWRDDQHVVERYRVPVPDGIQAITTCPAEHAGAARIVLGTRSGLWLSP